MPSLRDDHHREIFNLLPVSTDQVLRAVLRVLEVVDLSVLLPEALWQVEKLLHPEVLTIGAISHVILASHDYDGVAHGDELIVIPRVVGQEVEVVGCGDGFR